MQDDDEDHSIGGRGRNRGSNSGSAGGSNSGGAGGNRDRDSITGSGDGPYHNGRDEDDEDLWTTYNPKSEHAPEKPHIHSQFAWLFLFSFILFMDYFLSSFSATLYFHCHSHFPPYKSPKECLAVSKVDVLKIMIHLCHSIQENNVRL